jgi:uncharacterized protein (TIGR02246 family)
MKQIIRIALLIVAALSFSSCATTEPSASSSATPATAATAAASPAENVEQTITKLEREWAAALVKADAAAFDRLMADDWLMTTWDGQTVSKAQSIEEFKSGVAKLTAAEIGNLKVRVFGDTAVATIGQTEKGTYKGQDSSGHYLYTDVWVKRNGQWQAVASHGTKVKQSK